LFQAMALGTFHGLTAKGTTRQQENKKKPKNGKVGEKRKGGGVPKTKPKATAFKPNEMGWKCQKQ